MFNQGFGGSTITFNVAPGVTGTGTFGGGQSFSGSFQSSGTPHSNVSGDVQGVVTDVIAGAVDKFVPGFRGR
jgi:hypothetical protein